jgi:hypothetical protein
MCLNIDAIGWARHDFDGLAKAQAHKANPSQCSHISMTPTKRTLCDSSAVHAQYYLPHVRAQTNLVSDLNKKYQT